ncbi:MAG: hypothetical protein ACYCVZ_05040 [Streptosporangiaceae bacterium]
MSRPLSGPTRDLIECQRGVLARWQTAARPPDAAAIDGLLRSGRWRTLYRGVYATFTGDPPWESVLWAAVLRCGIGAALSYQSAAELGGLVDRPGRAAVDLAVEPIHVTVPVSRHVQVGAGESAGRLPPLVLHRSTRIADTIHTVRIPPRTRIDETVLDLIEGEISPDAVYSWLAAACGRRLCTPRHLQAAALRRARMRWRAEVLAALSDIDDGVLSQLERLYLRNVERPHQLPQARRQVRVPRSRGSSYLDNLYDGYGVAVELDGRAAHPPQARWRDIHRDNYFAGSGIVTLRYNWADVTERRCLVAAEVGQVLRSRGWTGRVRKCGPGCLAVGGPESRQ